VKERWGEWVETAELCAGVAADPAPLDAGVRLFDFVGDGSAADL
jgi:hypothetical protein